MSLSSLESYSRPRDLSSALRQLELGGSGGRIMAAGTDLVLHGGAEITALVDLNELGLSYVEARDGAIAIGAMTTLTDVLENPIVAQYSDGVIPGMLRQVGSPLLRNVATIGGNLMRRQPWSDVIPLFMALGASVVLFDGESHSQGLHDLYRKPGRPVGSILTEVVLPPQPAHAAAAFRKHARSTVDVATLNCAVMVEHDDGRCADARLFVGATPRLAQRVPAAEDCLVGEELTAATISVAATAAATTLPTGDDLRATATYRTRLVAVGITRCLEEVRHRLGKTA